MLETSTPGLRRRGLEPDLSEQRSGSASHRQRWIGLKDLCSNPSTAPALDPTPQAGVEFHAQLLKVGVDLTTQLLEASVQVVEAFGNLLVRLFQLSHADFQSVGGHHCPYYDLRSSDTVTPVSTTTFKIGLISVCRLLVVLIHTLHKKTNIFFDTLDPGKKNRDRNLYSSYA